MWSKALAFLLFIGLSSQLFARDIDFTWQAFPEAVKYELQVSEKKSFKKILFKKKTKEPQVKANLGMGQYYYRVRAFDSKNRAGIWSKPMLLTVTPYPPKPLSPKKGAKYNYFEEKNEIEFSWEKLDGKVSYQLLVQTTAGKTVIEKKTKKNKIVIRNLKAGDYSWKVRAVIQKRMITNYTESRFLFVTKTPIKPPELINPKDKSSLAAYRDDEFIWKKDSVAKYTDIELERLDKDTEDVDPLLDVEGEKTKLPMLMPGTYRWRVTTKETEDSDGISSDWAEFRTSTAVLSKNNHIFRFTSGYQRVTYKWESSRTGGYTGNDSANSVLINLYTRLQYSEGFGLSFDVQEQTIEVQDNRLSYGKNTIGLDFRFGEKDFKQSSIIGLRLMDQYDFGNSTAQKLTTHGLVFGLAMDGYLTSSSKLRLSAYYYKPAGFLQGGGSITADTYELRVNYSYNMTERFWIDWEFAYDKVIFKFDDSAGISEVSRWSYDAVAPINVSLSYEY